MIEMSGCILLQFLIGCETGIEAQPPAAAKWPGKLARHEVPGKTSRKDFVPAGRWKSGVLSGRLNSSDTPPDTACLANFRGRFATGATEFPQFEN